MTNRKPAEVFPPGEFIRDELVARGWKQADLAEILNRPLPVVHGILSGKTGITPETARGLAAAFDTSAELWLNLESAYQLSRVQAKNDSVARRARLYAKAPIREMIKRRWIEPSNNVDVLEQQVLRFFQIDDLEAEFTPWPHAARRSRTYQGIAAPLAAWLFRARYLAESVQAASFKTANVRSAIQELRVLLGDAEEIRRAPAILAEHGIRFLVIEPLARTRIDGACLWIDNAPVIALSMRYDRIDAFWFTLIHELVHADKKDGLQGSNTPLDIDLVGTQRVAVDKPDFENTADREAAEALVPEKDLDDFILRVKPLYSKARIQGFANRLKVHPGIVIGQLQFRGEISYAHSRRFLEPVRHRVTQAALTDGWGYEAPGGMVG